ncbi:MAG: 30S ribosome-binding factor RbfA [Robiginitomaculum sp.]|nr:30S ribosome-binding factor RbfA [Robiginitomaculum sp.]MDQ7078710.1 30S ribosome-binding factor RbfA [Robiginitomaculum sp.]
MSKKNKAPTQRQLRAGELVRHALVDVLAREELRDPDLKGTVLTITEVRCSPDLRHANVFCIPLGGKETPTVIKAMNRCSAFLRGRLGREIDMKFTPKLVFEADNSFDTASHISELLHRPDVARDLTQDEDG